MSVMCKAVCYCNKSSKIKNEKPNSLSYANFVCV
uniref:Uncharacterized protein n=1 Tax=Anguilla anguilla TaxID=7936 RepID=A0A0E9QE78_ANGAN